MSGKAIALDIKNYSKETRTLHMQTVLWRCYHLQLFCMSTGIPPFQIYVTSYTAGEIIWGFRLDVWMFHSYTGRVFFAARTTRAFV